MCWGSLTLIYFDLWLWGPGDVTQPTLTHPHPLFPSPSPEAFAPCRSWGSGSHRKPATWLFQSTWQPGLWCSSRGDKIPDGLRLWLLGLLGDNGVIWVTSSDTLLLTRQSEALSIVWGATGTSRHRRDCEVDKRHACAQKAAKRKKKKTQTRKKSILSYLLLLLSCEADGPQVNQPLQISLISVTRQKTSVLLSHRLLQWRASSNCHGNLGRLRGSGPASREC